MPWQTPLVVRNNSPRAEGFLYGFYPGGETPAITIYPLRGFGREQGAGGRDILFTRSAGVAGSRGQGAGIYYSPAARVRINFA